jgi:hypothetical protein
LIGSLLAQGGETGGGSPGAAAALNRGAPIETQAPATGPTLAPLLKNAVAESGVFYEAHQAQWLAGKRPLSDLLREPQGRLSPVLSQSGAEEKAGALPSSATNGLLVRAADGELTRQPSPAAAQDLPTTTASQAGGLPPDVAPVVRQQLEALSSQQIAWQGQIWPGQTVEWEIEAPPRDPAAESPEAQTWNTTLRLTLPELGKITARLRLDGTGVALDLRAADDDSIAALQGGLPELAQAMEAAGVPLRGSLIGTETPPAAAPVSDPTPGRDDALAGAESAPPTAGSTHAQ